jgi:DNA-binding MarR family transcriptional regulator
MPSMAKLKLRLQDYLPYRLSVAANAVSQLIARSYQEKFSLKIPQWRLLAVLAEEGPLTPQTLCGRTIMDKVTVMRAARGLLRRRLIKQLPNDHDGRSHMLSLTKLGERLYARIVPWALRYETQLLSGIDAREIERLDQLLRQVEDAARSLVPD